MIGDKIFARSVELLHEACVEDLDGSPTDYKVRSVDKDADGYTFAWHNHGTTVTSTYVDTISTKERTGFNMSDFRDLVEASLIYPGRYFCAWILSDRDSYLMQLDDDGNWQGKTINNFRDKLGLL